MSASEAAGSPVLRALVEGVRIPPALGYFMRVSAATLLTFWLAFFLQLPTPYSAVTTVFIVANPVRGAIVSKSAWRLGGTVVGAAAAVVQFALFGQAPILFDLFMAIWVGLCCAASSLLRFFASYGTVLAGYTIVIVDVGSLAHPDAALLTALYRISVVALGIVVTGIVFLLTQATPPVEALEAGAASGAFTLARLVRDVLSGAALDAVRTRRRDLSLDLASLEQSVVLAGADSLDVRNREMSLRYALTRLTGALASGVHAAQLLVELRDDAAAEARRVFADGLDAFLASGAAPDRAAARDALAGARDTLEALMTEAVPLDLLAAIDQARETVERLGRVLDDLDRSRTGGDPRLRRLRRFLDWRSAGRNGVRGMLTVGLASVFWYVTEWPAGPTLLAYIVPAVALLSNMPAPGAAAVAFAQGTVAAVLMATIFQPVVLPVIDGFPLAIGVLLLFAAPGIVGQLSPRWGGAAFSYLVFFNTGIALQNPMRFELGPLLNNDEAYLLGCAGLILVFRLLVPPDNRLVADYLAASVGRAARRLARDRSGGGIDWENVQIQKILQMSDRLALLRSPRRAELVEDAAAGLMVGRLVTRLRALVAAATVPHEIREAVETAIARIGRLARDPARDADLLAGEAVDLLGRGSSSPVAREAAAMIHEAARLIRRHEAFFANRLAIG